MTTNRQSDYKVGDLVKVLTANRSDERKYGRQSSDEFFTSLIGKTVEIIKIEYSSIGVWDWLYIKDTDGEYISSNQVELSDPIEIIELQMRKEIYGKV